MIVLCEKEYISLKTFQYFINFKAPLEVCPIDKQEYCITYETKFTKDNEFDSFDFKSRCKFCSKNYESLEFMKDILGLKNETRKSKIMTSILKKSHLPVECTWSKTLQFILDLED